MIVANTEQGFEHLLIGYPAIVPRSFGDDGLYSHHICRVRPLNGSPLTPRWLYLLLVGRRTRRGSSPKLLALNTSLVSAPTGLGLRAARRDAALWGREVESAVGAHLVNTGAEDGVEVSYWRDRGREVDLVLQRSGRAVGIEVTSGRRKNALPGLSAFRDRFEGVSTLLVGGQGIPLEDFLSRPAVEWLR